MGEREEELVLACTRILRVASLKTTTLSKHKNCCHAATLWHKNIGPAVLDIQEHPGSSSGNHKNIKGPLAEITRISRVPWINQG